MGDPRLHTIDELAELVADALRADYPGRPNGRVRDVPDRRTIRWYSTIGLLDRPAEMRGRTAYYGRRHLLQLVAVKRLQAAGQSLAQVQQRLVGATDEVLARIARLPDAAADAPADVPETTDAPDTTDIPDAASGCAQSAPRTAPTRERFWVAHPAPSPHSRPRPAARTGSAPDHATAPTEAADLMPAIRLAAGVTLLLDTTTRQLDPDDIAAIRRAAGPLLDALRERGLDTPTRRTEPSP
jgi:DNA-binding transcriptional MerR regulator